MSFHLIALRYVPVFAHGLIAGTLLALTASGFTHG